MARTAINYNGGPIQSLRASSSTGAGTPFVLNGGYSNFTAYCMPTTAGAGTASAQIEGSIDGTNWIALSAATTASTAGRMFNSTAGYTVGHARLVETAEGSTATVVNGWLTARY